MKKLNLAMLLGAVALLLTATSTSASVIWIYDEPKMPESLCK